jgi:cadherin 18 type 2
VCFADNPGLLSYVTVGSRVLDVNDNPPELAKEYDIVVCENSKPGQVSELFPSHHLNGRKVNSSISIILRYKLPNSPV